MRRPAILLYHAVHFYPEIIGKELDRPGFHGDALQCAGHGHLMNAELVGDLGIAKPFLQPFLFENIDVVHTPPRFSKKDKLNLRNALQKPSRFVDCHYIIS